jgi:hypothetical protein
VTTSEYIAAPWWNEDDEQTKRADRQDQWHQPECRRARSRRSCSALPRLGGNFVLSRRQINSLAEVGFHVVTPDMRGYGKSDQPEAIGQYTIFHLVGDLVGLLDGLEAPRQSPSAMIRARPWQAARLRPDRFRAIISLSVPFQPRSPAPDQPDAANG